MAFVILAGAAATAAASRRVDGHRRLNTTAATHSHSYRLLRLGVHSLAATTGESMTGRHATTTRWTAVATSLTRINVSTAHATVSWATVHAATHAAVMTSHAAVAWATHTPTHLAVVMRVVTTVGGEVATTATAMHVVRGAVVTAVATTTATLIVAATATTAVTTTATMTTTHAMARVATAATVIS